MSSRRKFIEQLSLLGIGTQLDLKFSTENIPFDAGDWKAIKAQFPIGENSKINLNSGSSGSMPYSVLKNFLELTEQYNQEALYLKKSSHDNDVKNIRMRLANYMDCYEEELAFTKNTTESLNGILLGFPLKKEDEVVIADCDYPYVVTSLENRARKESFTINKIAIRPAQLSNKQIIEAYKKAINKKTKLLVVTMITHREGQIMPVKELVELAHNNKVDVLVDGAHALGQIAHSIKDLNCDYYASCMHKWMNSPTGIGLLYVRKDKIEKLHPSAFPYPESVQDKIVKFEYSGTIAFQKLKALESVMDFNERIDIKDKQKRLHSLTKHWYKRLSKNKMVILKTDINRSCALSGFSLKGDLRKGLRLKLLDQYGINAKSTGYPGEGFLRVSTNLYIDKQDMDQLVQAVNNITQS